MNSESQTKPVARLLTQEQLVLAGGGAPVLLGHVICRQTGGIVAAS